MFYSNYLNDIIRFNEQLEIVKNGYDSAVNKLNKVQ